MTPKQKPAARGPLLPGVAEAVAAGAPAEGAENGAERPKRRRPGRQGRPKPPKARRALEPEPDPWPEEGPDAVFRFHTENFHRDAYDAGVDGTRELADEALRLWREGDRLTALVYQYEVLTRGLLARIKNTVDMAETAGLHKLGPRGREEMRGILEAELLRFKDLEGSPKALAEALRLKSERPAWLDPDAPARPLSPFGGIEWAKE